MSDERLLHYAAKPIEALEEMDAGPRAPHGMGLFKPRGLWVSVGEAWKEWCEGEDFGIERLACVHEVILAHGANILRIGTPEGIDAFTAKYLFVDPECANPNRRLSYDGIDWPAVAKDYQGIIISPYIWERRLDPKCLWLYTLDCASGCIWDVKAVASIRPLEPAQS